MAPTYDPAPRLQPGLDDLSWNIPASLDGGVPILAILELPLRPGVDLLDADSPVHRLLRKTLEYIASIPATRVFSPRIVGEDGRILLLVQLPNARAWQDLQRSAALELLHATLDANPSNRCVPLQLPDSFASGGRIELLTIAHGLHAESYSSPDRDAFVKVWSEFTAAVKATGTAESIGSWLEADCMTSLSLDQPVGRRAAILKAWDDQLVYFVGLMVDKSIKTTPEQRDRLRAIVSQLSGLLGDRLSCRILEIMPWTSDGTDNYLLNEPSQPTTTETLLKSAVRPVYRKECGVSIAGYDSIFIASHNAVHSGERQYPVPQGRYHPLGNMNQYSCPLVVNIGDEPAESKFPVDIIWLHFRSGALFGTEDHPSDSRARFKRVRKQIWQNEHCKDVKWARRLDDKDTVALFIIWHSRQSRLLAIDALGQLLEVVSDISELLCESPFGGASWDTESTTLHRLLSNTSLELTTFTTANTGEMKRLLAIHHAKYTTTAEARNVRAGTASAGRCISSGFAFDEPSQESLIDYTSLWLWQNGDARNQWYQDFHQGRLASYERLGHIAEGLHLISNGGIKSVLLELQLENLGFGEPNAQQTAAVPWHHA